MKIVKKAYLVWAEDLSEPWHYENLVGYGDTAGQAKSDVWKTSDIRDAEPLYDVEVAYWNLKAKRLKEEDIIEYETAEGIKEIKRYQIVELEWVRKRDEEVTKLTSENPDSKFLIYAGCYAGWWGANKCGYGYKRYNAGQYSAEEALKIVKGSDYSRRETLELLDPVKFNEEITKEVYSLQDKINSLESDIKKLKSKLL